MKKRPEPLSILTHQILTDPRFGQMSNEEVGCIAKIVSLYWEDGSVDSEPKSLANICRCSDKVIKHLMPTLKQLFEITEDGLVYRLLNDERERLIKVRESRSQAASKAARAKWAGYERKDKTPEKRRTKEVKEFLKKIPNWHKDKRFLKNFEKLLDTWGQAFPEKDIKSEILAAYAWTVENPNKPKKDFSRFMGHWLRNNFNGKSKNEKPNYGKSGSSDGF